MVKRKNSEQYSRPYPVCTYESIEACKARFADYRDEWKNSNRGLDFDNVQIIHRTVITTEWEAVGWF